MPIYKNSEPLPERPIILVLFGDPGVCKTSLFNTCDDPLLIDFDRGVDRCILRKDTFIPKNWEEVEKHDKAGDLDGYKTIGIDTAKACLDDFLMVHVIDKDHKLQYNKLRAFGEIGDRFKAFVNMRRVKDADIVIIAHAKKEDDTKKIIPDVTGQSYSLIMRIADQVGYVTIENGQRVISFEPSDMKVGKNVACLEKINIPDKDSAEFVGFGGRLIKQIRESISKMSEEQRVAMEQSEKYQEAISAEADINKLHRFYDVIGSLPDYLKLPLENVLNNRYSEAIRECTDANGLTSMVHTISNIPEHVNKDTLKNVLGKKAKDLKLKYSKDDGCYISAEEQKVKAEKENPHTSKMFAKKHQNAEQVGADISIATTIADLQTIYKYNSELIENTPTLADEYTAKEQELNSETKEVA